MEIVFESTGSSDNFDAWLQSFKEINNSLLIEVDTKEQQFVAKTFTKEKTIVKYGKLKFESAGFEILSITGKSRKKMTLDEFNAENPQRIKVGIFCVLDKFINVVKRFSGSDNFKFIIKFDESGSDFVARSIELKSLALKMVVTCANIEEFIYIKDEDFENKIAALDNPISVEVNSDVIKYLIDKNPQ